MKKKVFGRNLSRERSSRDRLFVSLVESLVLHGKITTTKAKAKAIIGLVDRLVVLSKKGSLAAKRQVLKRLKNNKEVSTKLWTDIAKTFENRVSGFTRIIPLTQRKGDMAEMVRLEWVEEVVKTEAPKKEAKVKPKVTKTEVKKVVSKSKKEVKTTKKVVKKAK